MVKTMSGGDEARRSAAPVKQLLRRLQYRLRSAARQRRAAPVRFGYDMRSYSQNFDDGLGCSAPPTITCS
ncbi:hypothetical protein PR202_gb08240 [Eleusine coracana subsp. coracana]|uniref:Uncharacterized protein n=1 Tax=Eleusine coracana subsp. coracana TaxID=191504 RepID=A0AAV5EE61_ELECO|nr:hypothetical protein PR202_gb08240 [Eleusine coracana subsp. coracana]